MFRRPLDRVNFGARLEHSLTSSHTLRASFSAERRISAISASATSTCRTGPTRATQDDHVFRLAESGAVGAKGFNELRFQALDAIDELGSVYDDADRPRP